MNSEGIKRCNQVENGRDRMFRWKQRRVPWPRGRCGELDRGLAKVERDRERVVHEGMAGRHAIMRRVSKTVKDLGLCPQSTSRPSKDPSRMGGRGATRSYMQTGH